MLRRLGAASVALLGLFHLWLFADQIRDGALLDPGRLARWAIAGSLVIALWWLRRRGISLWRSRPAIAVWIIAALLHAPTVGGSTIGPAEASLPDIVATLIPIAVAAAAGLAMLAFGARAARRSTPPARGPVLRPAARGPRPTVVLPLLSPRPPPHAV